MARYLFDSHTFLWIKTDAQQIKEETLSQLADPNNRVYLSLAAVWELAIKSEKGKLGAFARLAGSGGKLRATLRESGIDLLPIDPQHVLLAANLSPHHRDPFDRLMIAQAKSEDLEVVTRDAIFVRYGVRVLRI